MSFEELDYYQILGVSADASEEEIKRAYRKRAMENHPDHNGGIYAEKAMQDINEAYETLSNPEKRKEYDYKRKHQEENADENYSYQENYQDDENPNLYTCPACGKKYWRGKEECPECKAPNLVVLKIKEEEERNNKLQEAHNQINDVYSTEISKSFMILIGEVIVLALLWYVFKVRDDWVWLLGMITFFGLGSLMEIEGIKVGAGIDIILIIVAVIIEGKFEKGSLYVMIADVAPLVFAVLCGAYYMFIKPIIYGVKLSKFNKSYENMLRNQQQKEDNIN